MKKGEPGPRLYDRSTLVPEICALLRAGVPMTQICERDGFPEVSVVNAWCGESPSIALAIAHARDEFFDRLAVDCLTIADTTEEDPASRRVRVETRLRLLAKWCPRRYGDAANPNSQTVNVAVGVHVLTEEQRAVLVKARREALAGTGDGAGRVMPRLLG